MNNIIEMMRSYHINYFEENYKPLLEKLGQAYETHKVEDEISYYKALKDQCLKDREMVMQRLLQTETALNDIAKGNKTPMQKAIMDWKYGKK